MMDLEELALSRMLERRNRIRNKHKSESLSIQNRMNAMQFPVDSFELLQKNEIWEHVFEYLKNPLDLSSVVRVCFSFENCIWKMRELIVTTEVLKLLKEKHYLGIQDKRYNDGCSNKNLLKLRLVCKSWKLAMENVFFDINPETFVPPYFLVDPPHIPTSTRFTSTEQLDHAKRVLEKSESVSSLIGILLIEYKYKRIGVCKTENEREELHSNILDFLDVFGGKIKWLEICQMGGNCGINNYKMFCELLRGLPNLKGILFTSNIFRKSQWPVRNIEEIFRLHSVPPIKSLELVWFHGRNYGNQEALVLEILSKFPQIKYLKTPNTLIARGQSYQNLLANLRLEKYVTYGYIYVLQKSPIIFQNWHLKTLICNDVICDAPFFALLNKLGEHLEYIEIWFIPASRYREKLCLPSLKRVTLHDLNLKRENVDFLIEVPTIRFLDIHSVRDKNSRTVPMSSMFVGSLNESNIRKLCPNLKYIKIPGELWKISN